MTKPDSSSAMITRPAGISKTIFILAIVIAGAGSGLLGYYAGGGFKPAPPQVTLNGGGATFPYPLLSAWTATYAQTHPGVLINYQAQGSGFGVTNLEQKTLDFSASDAPLSDSERALAVGSLHIPETIGAVAIAYNVPEIGQSGLKLDAPTIAQVFQQNSTALYWDDAPIATLNSATIPTCASNGSVHPCLPHTQIHPVHRADSSGTTFIFTSWLVKDSSGTWVLGAAKSVAWTGSLAVGQYGNQAVAGAVLASNSYAIGYVELNYAIQNKMKTSYVKNPAGTYVQPTLQNSTYAVANSTATTSLPAGDQSWKTVTLLDASGTTSYPLVSFTYILVYKEVNVIPGMDLNKAKVLVDFLWWAVHDGQSISPQQYFVPLPQSVVTIDETTIKSITFNGQTLHS